MDPSCYNMDHRNMREDPSPYRTRDIKLQVCTRHSTQLTSRTRQNDDAERVAVWTQFCPIVHQRLHELPVCLTGGGGIEEQQRQ